MDFENESLSSSPSTSTSSSPTQLLSSCNNKPNSPTSQMKRKAGRKKFKETRHPIYRGVRQRNGNKWVCEVREPNKKTRIWLGTYPTPEMAARAHDVAVLSLKGTSAVLNFPDSASLLLPLVPQSSSPSDIREAASKAANAFTTPTITTTTTSSLSLNNLRVETSQERVVGEGLVKSACNDDDDEYSRSMFFDEEVVYNMPGFLDSMAEGLLITPPSMKRAFDWDEEVDCDETDLTLWTD